MGFRSGNAISENSIVFFEGGHDHDGVSSSLIDTGQYSIYDFTVGKIGSNQRQINQQRNFDNLKIVIANVIKTDVLGPSGVRLLPNSVQSVHIAAGAITANELAANIVLVNNVIRSNNYVANTSGWVLYSNGAAEFGAASIRGTLTAGAVVIDNNNFWNTNGFKLGGDNGIYTDDGTIVIGTDVDVQANVNANSFLIDNNNFWNAGGFSFKGSNGITSVTIDDIGNVVRLGRDIYINPSDGSIFSGDGRFQITPAGSLIATGGSIGNWKIQNDSLTYEMTHQEQINGELAIGKFEQFRAGLRVEDESRVAKLELVSADHPSVSDVRLYVGNTAETEYFKTEYDIEGNMTTQTTGYITAVSGFFGSTFSTGDHANPSPDDGTYFSDNGIYTAGTVYADGGIQSDDTITANGGIESGDMIIAGGTGVYYNASNLSGGRFGIAFGWDNDSGSLSCIINNDPNVDPYFFPDGFYSDRRQKENIQPITPEILEKIYSIKIYEFDYKNDMPQSWLRGQHGIGVIADELQTLLPEFIVGSESPEEYQQVVYVKMIPHLLAAINDLNDRLKAIEQHLGYNS
jgi:hypothetical protein